jgi:hypothetical protein
MSDKSRLLCQGRTKINIALIWEFSNLKNENIIRISKEKQIHIKKL